MPQLMTAAGHFLKGHVFLRATTAVANATTLPFSVSPGLHARLERLSPFCVSLGGSRYVSHTGFSAVMTLYKGRQLGRNQVPRRQWPIGRAQSCLCDREFGGRRAGLVVVVT